MVENWEFKAIDLENPKNILLFLYLLSVFFPLFPSYYTCCALFLLSWGLWILANQNCKINRGSRLCVKLDGNEEASSDREVNNDWWLR